MKRILSIGSIILLMAGTSSDVQAQNFTLEDVGRTSVRNIGSIMQGNIVKGYYAFYFSERVDRKNSLYEIVILDENLAEVASETIRESKRTYLLESAFNGETILFKFYDKKEKNVLYRSMNLKGELSSRTVRPANKQEIGVYLQTIGQELENTNLHSFGKNGFVDIYVYKDRKYGYQVQCIDNNGDIKWTHTANVDKGYITGGMLAFSDDQLLVAQGHSKNIMSRDVTFSLLALDNNGEELYTVALENRKYNLVPSNAVFKDDNSVTLIGEYYDIDDKAAKAAPQGVFVQNIDDGGGVISENFVSWSRDVAAKVSSEHKREVSKYSIYIHNVVMTSDGKVLAIGEQYRKQVSAGGVAMKVAAAALSNVSTDASAFEIEIGNLVIMTLTEAGELENVDILEKRPNKIILEEGYGLVNQHLLAKLLKAKGAYDYAYLQNNEDNSLISIAYTDTEKVKGKLRRTVVLNIVTFSAGERDGSGDKISLETDATSLGVYPAKPGHVFILEYFRKKKTLELRLEPINY